MHEVARLAGVSHTTVSRYLQDHDSVKPKTRVKVEFAVKTLDYRPNLVARSMRTRRTNRLAIVLAAGSHFPGRQLAAASGTAHQAGYQVDVVSVEGGPRARSARIDDLARSGQVDGILAISSIISRSKSAGGVPVVESENYDEKLHVLGELAGAAEVREIVEYLAGLGHETFLHVAGDQTFASARNRKSVYLATIERLGLRSVGVLGGEWSAQCGFDAITSLPEGCGVTAVVAANDVVATGVVRGALSRGWRVPDDLSVFGWDDEEIARFTTPSLSTVAVDREGQGRDGIHRLLAAINGEPAPQPVTRKVNQLIFRESTAPPPS
ncbi:LacI family DNA-binding transcriptional regulator [Kribbella sandramycini]|uniref:LacI family DNA-binding transcriptional regulator n=1 Tax=Kribbella sandramycini TaxID=60450 RepID=A0A7Y4L7A3_9ACTN|nr:LacI family DNA-binding transcriptional regulator [Kribbella sandramycini]